MKFTVKYNPKNLTPFTPYRPVVKSKIYLTHTHYSTWTNHALPRLLDYDTPLSLTLKLSDTYLTGKRLVVYSSVSNIQIYSTNLIRAYPTNHQFWYCLSLGTSFYQLKRSVFLLYLTTYTQNKHLVKVHPAPKTCKPSRRPFYTLNLRLI